MNTVQIIEKMLKGIAPGVDPLQEYHLLKWIMGDIKTRIRKCIKELGERALGF